MSDKSGGILSAMATKKKEWLVFLDAIFLLRETVCEIEVKVPLERLIEECSRSTARAYDAALI